MDLVTAKNFLPFIFSGLPQTTKDSIAIQLAELPEDPEVRFAKAIIDGDLEVVSEVLKKLKPDESCVLMNINVTKIADIAELSSLSLTQINPLDLAAHYGHDLILDHLIDYGLGMLSSEP